MSTTLGQTVGYSVRFDDCTSHATKVKYVTDGILLRECLSDKSLSKYSVIILDEAHERSLQTDILMGLLKQMQESRSDLKVVIMSATLDVKLFSSFFSDVGKVIIPGRQYPVHVKYLKEPEHDFVDAAVMTCLQIHEEEEEGDVLVFLPGQEDIESMQLLLEEYLPTIIGKRNIQNSNSSSSNAKTVGLKEDFEVRLLYAAMAPDDQLKVFLPSAKGTRKFILATNIAETSVTISGISGTRKVLYPPFQRHTSKVTPSNLISLSRTLSYPILLGIKYVVDPGYAKMRYMHPQSGMEMLRKTVISKSQANQVLLTD